MPAALRSVAQAQVASNASLSVTVPSDAEGGDLLVLMVATNGNAVNTTLPSGWSTLAYNGSTSSVYGRVLVKRAAGAKGTASSDASTTVTITGASATAVLGYIAVIKGAAAVRLLSQSFVSSSSSVTLNPQYAGARSLMVYFGATRVASSTMTPSRGTVQHRYNAIAGHSSVLATEAGPVSASSMTITSSPSGTAGVYGVALVAVDDVPTISTFDRGVPAGSWLSAAQFSTTAGRTYGNHITATSGGVVTAVWVYVGANTMYGQTITVGIFADPSASSPAVTVATTMQSSTGWQRVELPSPYTVTAGQTFYACVFTALARIWRTTSVNAAGSIEFIPRAPTADLTVIAGKGSAAAAGSIDNTGSAVTTIAYYVDVEYVEATALRVTGGGNADGTPQYPADMVVTGGGNVTVERATLAAVGGGGGAEIIAWQTEFPAPDAEDLPEELADPADYDEPEVLQTTFVMPDPVTFYNGVPVDWEPEVP
jgi:hypothetical protein